MISFSLNYNSSNYTKKISLKEIKDINSIPVFLQYSPQDFSDYLKALSETKQISLVKKDNIISIKFELKIMLRKHEIEIELISKDKNIELVEKDLQKLKKENNELREENKELNKKIENLEKEIKDIKAILNKNIKTNKSVIMKENEFDFIKKKIEGNMDKEVKELKKLYQATIDGDGALSFHSRCDGIPNTLILIKSAGNRRFGGFTSQSWYSNDNYTYVNDPNAFLFSIDKQKIYSYKNDGKTICNYKGGGPIFGVGYDININDHCILNKKLFTNQSSQNCCYNYDGDNNALSEDRKGSCIYAVEYEVFHVIFKTFKE